MKRSPCYAAIVLALLSGPPVCLFAQDNVTIPKSRLEELERKERELERLKTNQSAPAVAPTPGPTAPGIASSLVLAPAATAAPVIARPSPPIATLPPLEEGSKVEAIDLANYYHQDPASADERFKEHKFTLRGEIVGFEKPLFRRDYRVLLATGDRETRIVCNFYPPDLYSAVFTAKHGNHLMASQGDTRLLLAKVGETVLIPGRCKGVNDGTITFAGFEIARPK